MPTLIAIFIPFDFVDKNRVNEAVIVRTQYNLATLFFEKNVFLQKRRLNWRFYLKKAGIGKIIFIYTFYTPL